MATGSKICRGAVRQDCGGGSRGRNHPESPFSVGAGPRRTFLSCQTHRETRNASIKDEINWRKLSTSIVLLRQRNVSKISTNAATCRLRRLFTSTSRSVLPCDGGIAKSSGPHDACCSLHGRCLVCVAHSWQSDVQGPSIVRDLPAFVGITGAGICQYPSQPLLTITKHHCSQWGRSGSRCPKFISLRVKAKIAICHWRRQLKRLVQLARIRNKDSAVSSRFPSSSSRPRRSSGIGMHAVKIPRQGLPEMPSLQYPGNGLQ